MAFRSAHLGTSPADVLADGRAIDVGSFIAAPRLGNQFGIFQKLHHCVPNQGFNGVAVNAAGMLRRIGGTVNTAIATAVGKIAIPSAGGECMATSGANQQAAQEIAVVAIVAH